MLKPVVVVADGEFVALVGVPASPVDEPHATRWQFEAAVAVVGFDDLGVAAGDGWLASCHCWSWLAMRPQLQRLPPWLPLPDGHGFGSLANQKVARPLARAGGAGDGLCASGGAVGRGLGVGVGVEARRLSRSAAAADDGGRLLLQPLGTELRPRRRPPCLGMDSDYGCGDDGAIKALPVGDCAYCWSF